MTVQALAAPSNGAKLQRTEFDPGPLLTDQVEIDVKYCGIRHSDLMMIDGGAGMSQCPLVPTHRAGVIGLGHLALQFLKAWGRDVTAFTHSSDKADFAKSQGAAQVVNGRDPSALKSLGSPS